MDKKDYGYFGSGLEGYEHYMQCLKSTKGLLDEAPNKTKNKEECEQVQPGSPEVWAFFWAIIICIIALVEVILSYILVSSTEVIDIYKRGSMLWDILFGDGEVSIVVSILVHTIPLIGFFYNCIKARYFTK